MNGMKKKKEEKKKRVLLARWTRDPESELLLGGRAIEYSARTINGMKKKQRKKRKRVLLARWLITLTCSLLRELCPRLFNQRHPRDSKPFTSWREIL